MIWPQNNNFGPTKNLERLHLVQINKADKGYLFINKFHIHSDALMQTEQALS